MSRIHDRIREILETTPGLTQKGLAERMGLNPAAVNRMLYGRRNIMAEEIPVIESYLGQPVDMSAAKGKGEKKAKGFSDVRQQAIADTVPVMRGGKIVDWVPRHPAQSGIDEAFAVYIASDFMQPRYFRGEIAYIHPGRPPETGRDCLIELEDEKGEDPVIRRLIRLEQGRVRVQQFNPAKEKDIPAADIRAIYTVVGRG